MAEMDYYNPTKLPSPDTYGATVSALDPPGCPLDHGTRPPAGWDFVLVFPAPSSTTAPVKSSQRHIDAARLSVLHHLREASFSYSQLWIPSSGHILVRLALSETAMMSKAEHVPTTFRTRPEYSGGFIRFQRSRAYVFENFNRRLKALPFFTPSERIFITQAALRSNEDWGVDIDVSDLFKDGVIKQAFALHSRHERNVLISACVKDSWKSPFSGLPLYALQEYLGPRVTLYFAWLQFYTRMLTGIALFSALIFCIVVFVGNDTIRAFGRFSFGMAVAFWSSYWVRYWERRNAVLNVRWGIDDVDPERENNLREEFDGVNTPGFYSLGGFVHLSDLVEPPQEEMDDSQPDVDQVERSLPPPVASSSVNTGKEDEDGFIDDTQDEHVTSDAPEDGLQHEEDGDDENDGTAKVVVKNSERRTLTSLVSHQSTSAERVVIFGGETDADFTVEAPITGRTFTELPMFPFTSLKTVRDRKRISALVTAIVASFVGTLSFLILFFGPEINTFLGVERGSNVVTGVMTACLIIIADSIWKNVSIDLTKWENHQTTEKYEDSLILKRFAFQFVSNYLSLFYIAFAKPFTSANPCMINTSGVPDCMLDLQTQLMSVVITKATVEQIVELIMPNLLSLLIRALAMGKQKELRSAMSDEPEERERLEEVGAIIDPNIVDATPRPAHYLSQDYADEDALPSNDIKATVDEQRSLSYDGTIDDFAEIIIQYGYLVLFGVAFPPAAIISLLNNLIELRTDSYKILAFHKRPPVAISPNIGRWLPIIRFLSNLSTVTIVAVLTITTPDLVVVLDTALPAGIVQQLNDQPLISFVVAEHVLFFIRWIVTAFIADTPGSTFRLRARRSFLLSRCLNIGGKPFFRGRRHAQA